MVGRPHLTLGILGRDENIDNASAEECETNYQMKRPGI
jgi:hypothetical protein